MKYCSKCGTQLEDNALFCISCGEATTPNIKLDKDENAPLSNNPVIAKLKEILSSKMMLVIAILVSVAVGFGFIGSTSSSSGDTYYDDEYYTWEEDYSISDYDEYYNQMMAEEEGFGVDAVSVLAVIAAWMIYSAARDKSHDLMKTAGFTLIRVANIISFVINMIVEVALIIVGIALLVSPISSDIVSLINEAVSSLDMGMQNFSPAMLGVVKNVAGITVIIMAVGIMVLSIFVFTKLQNTVKSLKATAETGEPARNVSSFIGVMCYISGGVYGLSALNMVTNPILALSYGALSAALIMTGILLFKIRREMACFVPVPIAEPVAQVQAEQEVQSEVEPVVEPVVEAEAEPIETNVAEESTEESSEQ